MALFENGFQNPHIHPSGWISGVAYLNILEKEEPPNGAIQFSFNDGKYFSDDNNKTPLKTINPKIGDVILFPSSFLTFPSLFQLHYLKVKLLN